MTNNETAISQHSNSSRKLLVGAAAVGVLLVFALGFFILGREEQQITSLKQEAAELEKKLAQIDQEIHQEHAESNTKNLGAGAENSVVSQDEPPYGLADKEANAESMAVREDSLDKTKKPSAEIPDQAPVLEQAKQDAKHEVSIASKDGSLKKSLSDYKPRPVSGRVSSITSKLLNSFVSVPKGTFKMGIKKAGAVDARPVHKVTLSAFSISRFPITHEEFAEFKSSHRYEPQQGNHPVTNVSWQDAVDYANWLSSVSGRWFALPTESQWEYVARGLHTKDFHWGGRIGRNNANCDGCGSHWDGQSTSPVGSFASDKLGVYDLIGNVWEWTADCYAPNYQNASGSGVAFDIPNCKKRALRGGAWNTPAKKVHSAFRGALPADTRMNNIGFRLVEKRT